MYHERMQHFFQLYDSLIIIDHREKNKGRIAGNHRSACDIFKQSSYLHDRYGADSVSNGDFKEDKEV